jgi:hypothetical protein
VLGKLHDVGAGCPDTQQNSEEFGIGERFGAVVAEALAGAFVVGYFADAEMIFSHGRTPEREQRYSLL